MTGGPSVACAPPSPAGLFRVWGPVPPWRVGAVVGVTGGAVGARRHGVCSVVSRLVADLALAVDIGGTKLACGLVTEAGDLVQRAQVPTGAASSSGEELWSHLAALVTETVESVAAGDRLAVCGVGSGGPMSPGGEGVSPLNITGWRGFPLRRRMAELTGLPTFVDNDAKALALGEGWVGAAQGQRDYIGMVVSTGVGGGVVLDDRLLSGRLGNAGHVGHVIVVPDGRACPCGGRGCLEAEASGTALAAITGRPAAEAPPDLVARTGRLVGLAIASVANLLDLPLAVVSGSVALGFGDPFFAAAQAEMDLRCRLDFARGTRVVPGGLGDGGPLVGAARVGWRGLGLGAGAGVRG
jgi:glucokinase